MTDHEALEALSKKAEQTEDDIRYYSGGSKYNEPLEQLKDRLVHLYRTGQFIPAPSVDDAMVERVARAIDGADKHEGAIASVMHFDWVRDMRIAQAIAAISAMQVKP